MDANPATAEDRLSAAGPAEDAAGPPMADGLGGQPGRDGPVAIGPFLAAAGPLLDVRSPAEYAQGHIPGALSLPLFSDDERAEIGTLYKQEGRRAAVLRGLAMVGPRLDSLGAALAAAAADNAATSVATGAAAGGSDTAPLRIHCWRGGMRSGAVAWLARQLDLPVLLLEGGYKSYRRWVLELFERPWPLRLLGGRTGTGKTELLLALRERGVAVVDLEGRANHRGSSFGALGLPPQPSVEMFENLLAADLAALADAPEIWLEAESSQVGRCRIPAGLWRQMKEAAALLVERPLEWRVEQLVAVYGRQDPNELAEATRRIARRLGPQRTSAALEAIEAADWASACRQMLDYYDRCYDHDLSSHAVETVAMGERGPDEAAERLLELQLVKRARG